MKQIFVIKLWELGQNLPDFADSGVCCCFWIEASEVSR
jgi:hypothetical protein